MKRPLILLTLAPVLANDPGGPDSAFAQHAWTGKHTDQLIASWGKPRKTKRDGKGGKVLVYRLRFYGNQVVGVTEPRWSETGIARPGRTKDFDDPAAKVGAGDSLSFNGGLEVIATQKAKFSVDRQGIIQRQEFAPRKWKKKR